MWAFVTLGLLWIEQPRLGAPNAFGDAFVREAEAMSGAVLLKRAKMSTTCDLQTLLDLGMELDLCGVQLPANPILVLERSADDSGMMMRLALVQDKHVTRREEVHIAIDADAREALRDLMDRMFADYGDVQISGHYGMELFIDGRWMGALGKEKRVRIAPGMHAIEVRRRAEVRPLGQFNVLARNQYNRPLRLGVTEALALRSP